MSECPNKRRHDRTSSLLSYQQVVGAGRRPRVCIVPAVSHPPRARPSSILAPRSRRISVLWFGGSCWGPSPFPREGFEHLWVSITNKNNLVNPLFSRYAPPGKTPGWAGRLRGLWDIDRPPTHGPTIWSDLHAANPSLLVFAAGVPRRGWVAYKEQAFPYSFHYPILPPLPWEGKAALTALYRWVYCQ
jgi:hypothetical protein